MNIAHEFVINFILSVLLMFMAYIMNTRGGRVEILNIRASCESSYINYSTIIHSNGTKFDLNFTLHQPLPAHDLVMNMKMKMMPEDKKYYVTVNRWNGIDLCKFLLIYQEDVIFQHYFKSDLKFSSFIRCPIRPGRFELRNFDMQYKSESMVNGKYRFFMEIAQTSGEIVKLFAMQVTTQYHEE